MGEKMNLNFINITISIFFLISIYLTFKYRFTQVKSLSICLKVLKKEQKENSKKAYQTFLVSLANHIGVGNIVGVISALMMGGPGSIFWMWIYALFSSIFSIMENTLSLKYREKVNGEYRGGSAYYITKGLNIKNKIKYILSTGISIFLVLSNTILFQPLQVNTVSLSLEALLNVPKYLVLLVLLLLCIFIIFKGTKKIIKFSEIIVPIMSVLFILIGLMTIIFNIKQFPVVLCNIIRSAFEKESILSGCIFVGIKRSLFSHEAGLGTAPSITAMAENVKPIEEGYISSVGVFVDTIVMCSLTGFIILIYNVDLSEFTGVDLVINIFEIIFGGFGKYLAVFFLLTFALATIVSEFYLGESNMLFITKSKIGKIIYKGLFIIGIVMGIYLDTSSIWDIIDIGIILLGIVNIFSILKLRKSFEEELNAYNKII